jgi:hypothetical protein
MSEDQNQMLSNMVYNINSINLICISNNQISIIIEKILLCFIKYIINIISNEFKINLRLVFNISILKSIILIFSVVFSHNFS